jgi:T-complex protein 1 subunit epsilon
LRAFFFFSGALLEQAEILLDKGIHPIRVSNAYDLACNIAYVFYLHCFRFFAFIDCFFCSVEKLSQIADKVEWTPEKLEPLILAAMTALGKQIFFSNRKVLFLKSVVCVIICVGSKIVNKHCRKFAEIAVKAVLSVADLVLVFF